MTDWQSNILAYGQAAIGALIGALSVIAFYVPAEVAPSGISGVAVILNALFDTPIGLMAIAFNIPILWMGHRMLPGGWKMTSGTIFVVLIYSLAIDWVEPIFGTMALTDDRLLNVIFGGATTGLATGLIYRSGLNFGGTATLALILQRRTGLSMSTTFLYTDTLVIITAGLVFGLEGALYALVAVFIAGVATDYVMEGPSVIRTAIIITDQPDQVASAIIETLHRGVTRLAATGMYTGRERGFLYVTISRAQTNDLRDLVQAIDENAFIVIGMGHSAYGVGFKRNGKPRPLPASSVPDSGLQRTD